MEVVPEPDPDPLGLGGDPRRRVHRAAGGRVPQRARALQREQVPHQRGRRRRGRPRRAPPLPRRRAPGAEPVRVVVPQVDAVGQVRVSPHVVLAAAAAAAATPHPRGRCSRRRRHCGRSIRTPRLNHRVASRFAASEAKRRVVVGWGAWPRVASPKWPCFRSRVASATAAWGGGSRRVRACRLAVGCICRSAPSRPRVITVPVR